MTDPAQRQLGLRRIARLTSPIAVRGDVGNASVSPAGSGLTGEITFIVGVADDRMRPVVHLETLNLVFDPSPQLGGGRATPSARLAAGALPPVRFDAESRRVSALFELHVDIPAERAAREQGYDLPRHAPDPGMLPASVTVTGQFLTRFRPVRNGRELLDLTVRISRPEGLRSADLFPDEIVIDGRFTLTWLLAARPRRKLLVQPVYISASESKPATGSYFGPGLNRANEIWGECCIRFVDLSPPIFLSNQDYRVVTDQTVGALMDEVDVSGAIEVFLVESLEPVNEVRGGAITDGGGTAAAKIVTGDNQLLGNLNNLAHELGHVLGLCHPQDDVCPSGTNGCEDSVMEPSGFFDDNPSIQCAGNCEHAENPLLTIAAGESCAAGDGLL